MFKRYWWMLLVMAPVGMMAGFMIAAVVTYVMPKKYESFATIEIRSWERKAGLGVSMNPAFLPTEMQKIRGRNTLMRVADQLDLVNRWGTDRETALRILKGVVITENIRGTDLIQIRVRHTNKEDARDITAEVARAFSEYRQELIAESMEKGISELRKAVREQEDRVEEKRKILSTDPRNMQHRTYNLRKAVKEQEERVEEKRDTLPMDPSAPPSDSGTDPVDMQAWADAKRDFETDLALLEQLKLKLITEEISQGTSGDTVVVHDDPVIADAPISPNVPLNLVAGAFGGLLFSPFLALPLMWWMSRRNR